VVAGETRLFQIDPVALSNAVLAATQDLEVFKAGAKVAHANRESVAVKARKAQLDQARYARLHKEGRVSDNEFENIDTLHEQAKAAVSVAEAQIVLAESQVSRAEAALQIAQKNLDDTSIVAPLTGVISKRDVEPGEQMAVGRVMMTIVDPTSLEAAAFIPAQYYNDITPDQTHFRLAINGLAAGSFPIYYRSPTINPSLRTFEIKGKVTSDAAGAVPGSMADITLIFETRETLAVPSAAILERHNGAVVFVVRDGKAWQTPITTGLQNDGCTEVLAGLDSSAEVVYEGQVLLRDGSAVAIQ